MRPTFLLSVAEVVFDFPPLSFRIVAVRPHQFQELIAPEEVTSETAVPNTIPSALVPALDPACHLNCRAPGRQVKRHYVQASLQASSESGAMYVSHSQQTQPLDFI